MMFNMTLWTLIYLPKMTHRSHWEFKLHGSWKLFKNLGMAIQYFFMQHLAQIKAGYAIYFIAY